MGNITVRSVDGNGNVSYRSTSLKAEVFTREFVPIGWLDMISSLQWVEKPSSAGWFELWAPCESRNIELLREKQIIWLGDTTGMIIESIRKEQTQRRGLEMRIQGVSLEDYFNRRIVWGTFNGSGYVSDVMRSVVSQHVISPGRADRVGPMVRLYSGQQVYGSKIEMQNTGGYVHDIENALAETYGLGWELQMNPFERMMDFVVTQGRDLTYGNAAGNKPVVFDSDMEDILESVYFYNVGNYKSDTLVAGAGEGAARKMLEVGIGATGWDRREMFTDARDLSDTDENLVEIPIAIYNGYMLTRGEEKLGERQIVETFDAKLRTDGNVQYVYGEDYRKGDWVTVQDRMLDVTISAKVTEIEKVYNSSGYSLNMTFGFSQPQLQELIKQMIS